MQCAEVLARLQAQARPENVALMARFGVVPRHALGLSTPALQKLAREVKRDHTLAQQLWGAGVHEAFTLAALVDDPRQVTEAQMERWVSQLYSWDICDVLCQRLFSYTPYAAAKAAAWSRRPEEYVRRAGFVLMAALALKGHATPDKQLLPFLPLIRRGAADERNFVKKAVSWALRGIGKRNAVLNQAATQVARELAGAESRSARWVGHDALRELTSAAVQARLADGCG